MKKISALLGVVGFLYSASNAFAHEFWLSPTDYTVAVGEQMQVRLLQGTGMKGSPLIYLPADIARFNIVEGETERAVTARMGDEPALDMPAGPDGLAVVVHETMDSEVIYTDFAVFERFVTHKSFNAALAEHAARGLPQTGFSETYRRHAKSLISVGSGVGKDRAMGLKIEIVALANPYTDDLSAGMPLQVLLDGAPRADAQIELFQTAPDGNVTISLYRTNASGEVVVPVKQGMEYLVDTVLLTALPNNNPAAGPVWHSDWASLTFQTPD